MRWRQTQYRHVIHVGGILFLSCAGMNDKWTGIDCQLTKHEAFYILSFLSLHIVTHSKHDHFQKHLEFRQKHKKQVIQET